MSDTASELPDLTVDSDRDLLHLALHFILHKFRQPNAGPRVNEEAMLLLLGDRIAEHLYPGDPEWKPSTDAAWSLYGATKANWPYFKERRSTS